MRSTWALDAYPLRAIRYACVCVCARVFAKSFPAKLVPPATLATRKAGNPAACHHPAQQHGGNVKHLVGNAAVIRLPTQCAHSLERMQTRTHCTHTHTHSYVCTCVCSLENVFLINLQVYSLSLTHTNIRACAACRCIRCAALIKSASPAVLVLVRARASGLRARLAHGTHSNRCRCGLVCRKQIWRLRVSLAFHTRHCDTHTVLVIIRSHLAEQRCPHYTSHTDSAQCGCQPAP